MSVVPSLFKKALSYPIRRRIRRSWKCTNTREGAAAKPSALKVPWHEIKKVAMWLWQQELIRNAYALCRQTAVGYKWLVEVIKADSDSARRSLNHMRQRTGSGAY